MPTLDQNYSNHRRLDPAFHYVLFAGLLVLLVLSVVNLIRYGVTLSGLWLFIASILLFLVAFLVRSYALKAQDRVIRLEERLRLHRLLAAAQHPQIDQLTVGQIIALRFAPDEEVPALASSAISQNLTPDAIKKAIATWRADHFRI